MGITEDLIRKVGDDVSRAVVRVLSIAPDPQLPIALAATAAALGATAGILQKMARADMKTPDPDNIMLAALLAARLAIGRRNSDDATSVAYQDLAFLKEGGRLGGAEIGQ